MDTAAIWKFRYIIDFKMSFAAHSIWWMQIKYFTYKLNMLRAWVLSEQEIPFHVLSTQFSVNCFLQSLSAVTFLVGS